MRVVGWEYILNEEIEKRAKRPIKYGVHDCCVATGSIVYKITGVYVFSKYPKQRSKQAATQFLNSFGGLKNFIEQVTKDFGFEQISPRRATAGDVVLRKDEVTGECAVGIIGPGGRKVFFIGKSEGWTVLGRDSISYAWHIS